MTTLAYLKKELDLPESKFLSAFKDLTPEYKEWYKSAAEVEMKTLGIEVTKTS